MQYKVGDKVRIVKRVGEPSDYPFSFIDSMAAKVGNIYEIESIEPASDGKCKINGDFHLYRLKGDMTGYNWHSSMFEPFEELPTFKVGDTVRIISKHFDDPNSIVTANMRQYAGRIFKISQIFHSSNHTYSLDGDAYGYYWPENALEKVSSVEFVDDTCEVKLVEPTYKSIELEGDSIKIIL